MKNDVVMLLFTIHTMAMWYQATKRAKKLPRRKMNVVHKTWSLYSKSSDGTRKCCVRNRQTFKSILYVKVKYSLLSSMWSVYWGWTEKIQLKRTIYSWHYFSPECVKDLLFFVSVDLHFGLFLTQSYIVTFYCDLKIFYVAGHAEIQTSIITVSVILLLYNIWSNFAF